MNVNIQSVHFDADDKLKDFTIKKLSKLTTFYDKIIDSDVVLSLDQNGAAVKDKVALIKINIPGTQLVAKETSKVFEESIDNAVDALRRQLKKSKEKIKN
jgi:putative sigma-54 modulation protein